MPRFIVISSHTAEECKMAVKHFREHHAGFLSHFEWGCYDNDHTAYLVVEAGSHQEAIQTVPPLFRDKTRVVQLTYFNPRGKSDPIHEPEK
jgi:hypothetical protein